MAFLERKDYMKLSKTALRVLCLYIFTLSIFITGCAKTSDYVSIDDITSQEDMKALYEKEPDKTEDDGTTISYSYNKVDYLGYTGTMTYYYLDKTKLSASRWESKDVSEKKMKEICDTILDDAEAEYGDYALSDTTYNWDTDTQTISLSYLKDGNKSKVYYVVCKKSTENAENGKSKKN